MSITCPLSRATELVPNFPSADNALMTDCINAASDCIERYTNRTFSVTTYNERYNGTGFSNLLLNQYPVVEIDRVMFNPQPAIMIRNTNTSNTLATMRLDNTSLYLTTINNGASSTITLTLASYTTLTNLAAAISSAGSGWTGSALGIYGAFPVSDLFYPQGAVDARWAGAVYLKIYQFSLWDFTYNPEIGEIVAPFFFTPGYLNYLVQYKAGMATMPDDLVQACAEVAVAIYNARGINSNLAAENLTGWSYTNIVDKGFKALSVVARNAIESRRNYRMTRFKAF